VKMWIGLEQKHRICSCVYVITHKHKMFICQVTMIHEIKKQRKVCVFHFSTKTNH